MAGNTLDQAAQMLSGGAPGTTMVGSNTKVKGEGGFLGTQGDALLFSHGGTGNWIAANTRVRIGGVFAVSATAQGTSIIPGTPPVTVPITVVPGNPKIRST
jgi:hypothetical protein